MYVRADHARTVTSTASCFVGSLERGGRQRSCYRGEEATGGGRGEEVGSYCELVSFGKGDVALQIGTLACFLGFSRPLPDCGYRRQERDGSEGKIVDTHIPLIAHPALRLEHIRTPPGPGMELGVPMILQTQLVGVGPRMFDVATGVVGIVAQQFANTDHLLRDGWYMKNVGQDRLV